MTTAVLDIKRSCDATEFHDLIEEGSQRSTFCSRQRALHCFAIALSLLSLLPYVLYLAFQGFENDIDQGTFQHRQLTLLILSVVSFACCMVAMFQRSPIPRFPTDQQNGTFFGHLMSQQGEWNHIPVVLCATYSFVLCYGAIASLITDCQLLCIPSFYVCGLLTFYMWHWAAHVWEGSELKRIHMLHHQDRYPQEDFYGDQHTEVQRERADRGGRAATLLELMNPTGSTTTTWAHEGPLLLGIIIILLVARFVIGLSTGACSFIVGGLGFMGIFGSAIHMSFHERDFDLEPYAWYRELRSLHMIHHMHRKNFAMVNVLLDLVFCSLMLAE